MSKLSFRARALDATKSMPVYRKDEVADLPDYSVLHRAVPQMPTGMEKEEESEHHLQRAISAQQVYGDKKVMVIPVPEAEVGVDYYNSIYKKQFRLPKQYIHNQAQALNSIMEQEKPDYDMDSDDEHWVRDTNKRSGLEISDIQFEEMIDRLEKSCGNQVVSLQEAKLLLKEDDDLIKAVYDYWLQRRSKSAGCSLTFQVRQERRDGSSSGDSYVAFRRRTEKMQTRKNRKNDEASYEKMLKLRRDLTRAVTILEMVKRREKCKCEVLHLTLEVAEKRYQMKDWDGKCLKMAKREVAIGHGNLKAITGKVKHVSGTKATGSNAATVVKQRIKSEIEREKVRRSKKNKEKLRMGLTAATISSTPSVNATSAASLPGSSQKKASGVHLKTSNYPNLTYEQAVDTMKQYEFHSSDEDVTRPKSPISGSVAPTDDRKKNPDGNYVFKRKPGCKYEAPRDDLSGDQWPWMSDSRHRYSLTTLTMPEKCMGFCRRRVGRGGRILMDRAHSSWNKQLSEIDLHPDANHLPHTHNLQELLQEIKHGRWRRYRPYNAVQHKSQRPHPHGTNRILSDCSPKPFGQSSGASISLPDNKGLLQKRLNAKAHMKSPHKTKSPQKRIYVHGPHLDKPTALFAVSALVTSESSPSQKSRTKCPRPQQVRLSLVSSSSSAPDLGNTVGGNHNSIGGMTLIGNIPGPSPSKFSRISTPSKDENSAVVMKRGNAINRVNWDQAKLYGITTQEKIHATLMPVISSRPRSSTAMSVTSTMAGLPSKISLTTVGGSPISNDCIALTTGHLHSNRMNVKANIHPADSSSDTMVSQKSTSMPVVMATLRIGNQTSSASSPTVQAQVTSSIALNSNTTISNSFAQNNVGSGTSDSSGMVYITQTARSQSSKGSVSELQASGNLPLALSTVNSTTLVPSQYKNAPHGVLLGHQATSLNLALTPATPQKHATLSQLSIPNSSGHTPTILIATPASGTLASSLPPSCNTGTDVGASGTTTLNLNQAKTVSINVARVQPSSSGLGQIFTLQQHPDSSIGTLTVSGPPQQNAHHSGTAWVPSASGPNILKLGPPGTQAGIQIHPVSAGFKMGSNNKSLTVISKRPRIQQSNVNAARTISITNSKQLGSNHSKIQGVPSQITLLPDNRTALTSKSLISITPKSNPAVLLSSKNMSLEQTFPGSGDNNQTSAVALGSQPDSIVPENPGLSTNSKNGQPMEVT